MQDGMSWEADWYIDGTLDKQASIVGDTWAGGASGSWWVCATDQHGLPDGTYEVVLQVEGKPQAASALYVGDDHKVIDFEIDNQGTAEICATAISPIKAQNWGGDKLGAGVTLPSGSKLTIKVATGDYDILMVDCNGNTIREDDGVTIDKSVTYPVTAQ
jgi:hypothetical protein